jgi:hypothetical protein
VVLLQATNNSLHVVWVCIKDSILSSEVNLEGSVPENPPKLIFHSACDLAA